MADKLSVRLDDAWRKLYADGDEHDVCDTIAEAAANAHFIAACDPDTIRALLAERDALAAALTTQQRS